MSRKKFQYNYNEKKFTIIEFDVKRNFDNKIIVENISIQSNFYSTLPVNPKLEFNQKSNEYQFLRPDGVYIINGDLQQIIKRILSLANE
jgi:hypothetical protein